MIYLSAPDENPTGVQGFGTEHNNLVISWKVISSIRLILLILRHLLKSSHTAELDFVIVWSYELSLWGFVHFIVIQQNYIFSFLYCYMLSTEAFQWRISYIKAFSSAATDKPPV